VAGATPDHPFQHPSKTFRRALCTIRRGDKLVWNRDGERYALQFFQAMQDLCSHSQPVLLRDRTGLHLAFPSSSSNGPGHLSDEVDGTECSQRPSTKTASQRQSTAVNGIIVSRVE
jgi:hypothetical protein